MRELSAPHSATNFSKSEKDYDLETGIGEKYRKGSVTPLSDVELKDLSRHGSEEHIIDGHNSKSAPLEINVTTVYALVDEKGNEAAVQSPKSVEEESENNETGMAKNNNPFRAPTPRREREWRPRGENITEISVGERMEGSASKASRMLGMGGGS